MPEYPERSGFRGWSKRVGWFIGMELFCVVGFAVLLVVGQPRLAVAILAGPFQFLAWCALAGNAYAILVAFAALVPFATAELLPFTYYAYVLVPSTIGLLTLLLMFGRVFGAPPLLGRTRSPERVSMLVLSTWAIASGVLAASRGWGNHDLLMNTLLVVEVMILMYFSAVIPRSPQDIRVLLYVILVSMTVVAAWVPMASLASGSLGGKVVAAPFGDANLNIVACGLAMAGAVSLGLAARAPGSWSKLLLYGAALVSVMALVVTRSRGGWLGFGVAFLHVLVRSRSKGLLILAAVTAVALVTSDLLRGFLVSRASDTTSTDPSMLGRFVLWYSAWRAAQANWLFGVGMENFRYVKHLYGYPLPFALSRPFNAHNLYLEVLADLGVVGFVAFFFLLAKAIVSSWRAVKSSAAGDLGLALTAGFIACAGHGLVESVMFNPGIFALLGVLIGLALSLGRLTSGSVPAQRDGPAYWPSA